MNEKELINFYEDFMTLFKDTSFLPKSVEKNSEINDEVHKTASREALICEEDLEQLEELLDIAEIFADSKTNEIITKIKEILSRNIK